LTKEVLEEQRCKKRKRRIKS